MGRYFLPSVENVHVRFHSRYLSSAVAEDLDRKTVFVAGPRQVGKTTLALEFYILSSRT
jgi:predicted AAA+ superfamily ATPase